MRNKQAFKNMLSNIILQVIISISGIILPRFFIAGYGSEMNGLISSINQFITYMGLVEAGIGSAAIVSLYKPLADKDHYRINRILSGAKRFYFKSGYIFLSLVVALIIFYPMLRNNSIDSWVVRWMILILAGSGIVDYFLLGKYRVLLTADQRSYVITSAQSIGTILNTVITIGLIQIHANVLLVKLVATLVYVLRFIIIYAYARRHYTYINFREKPDKNAFKQRWDVLAHQISNMVVSNTDMITLTVFGGAKALLEVSVYSVYNLVGYALFSLMNAFNSGLTASFGEIISKGEKKTLENTFSNYEYMYFTLQSICYTCMSILILPFVSVYTAGITDAVYVRPVVAAMFCVIGYAQTIRTPGLTIICAAGHYTQTRNRALLEAAINLVVSIALVRPLGMVGVLIGTICSYAYRSVDIIIYNARYLVKGTMKKTLERIIRNLLTAAAVITVMLMITPSLMTSWTQWFLYAVLTGVVTSAVFGVVNFIFEPQQFKMLLNRLKSIFTR